LTALGLLGFAAATQWLAILGLGTLLGLGAGAIDAALNTYVATHYSARMLNWLHACFGVGAAGGPLIMTAVLRHGSSWRAGYTLVGAAQLALATCFVVTVRQWPRGDGGSHEAPQGAGSTMAATLRLPAAWLGMATFVAYAGIESSLGVWTYTLLTEGRGMATAAAGVLTSLFWGGMTAGRLAAAAGGGLLPVRQIMRAAVAAIAVATALILVNVNTATTAAGLLLAGLAAGPIFPSLIATTPVRVGKDHAANTVGFQIAASAIGLSVIPGLVGLAAGRLGMETIARLFVVLAGVLIVMYGFLERRTGNG
ncbi:MAG: MFS transporter, partial [Acidobacteriota bacterium]